MKKKRNDKMNMNPIRTALAVLIVVFVALVIFNAFRPNISADVDSELMDRNIRTVSELQTADIADIEKEVRRLDAIDARRNSANMIAVYRRMFSSSVILGDSLTEGLSVYGWLPKSIVFAEVGGSIIYGDDMFVRAAKTKPEYAFFAFGMNDMGNFNRNPEMFIERYSGLLKKFKKISPETTILVNSITTPTREARKHNKSIRYYKAFNKAIEKMCKEHRFTYINIADILPANKDLYAGDGIHAAPDYYPMWMDRMIKAGGLSTNLKK